MSKNKYHDYVYNFENKEFVGDFENMYAHEKFENYDSWFQEDQRHLKRRINQLFFNMFNFNEIVDYGCGKGSFTHISKKINNEVFGYDISETAIKIAQSRYPDITFEVKDLNDTGIYSTFTKNNNAALFIEVLSYLSNWEQVLCEVSKHFEFCLINLFLPLQPIGFIKSEKDLDSCIDKNFVRLYDIKIKNQEQLIILLKSKN